MNISRNMNLDNLAERMGSEATTDEATTMRAVLALRFGDRDTSDLSEAEWLSAMTDAMSLRTAIAAGNDELAEAEARELVRATGTQSNADEWAEVRSLLDAARAA